MKYVALIFTIVSFILASCRNKDKKEDPPVTVTDTAVTVMPDVPVEIKKDSPVVKTGQTRGLDTNSSGSEKNEILANIDKHLVSASQYTASPSGGITNGTVSITNTLPDATFQKVMVEVKIRKENGDEFKTDYYTVVNIEPGGVKVVKLPNTSQGATIITHIIKVKSTELTKGEFILSGIHFVPN
ncbi:MAG: hypothetical protein H7Y01_02905 [Ferruginibacter sp.]|nr:hypothetical protein [Chitinophagaceae bacterium]